MVAVGAGLLWLGWNGFNGGDPYFAGASASAAILNTNLCTAVAFLVWVAWDYITGRKPGLISGVNGMIVGLVAITPGGRLRQRLGSDRDRRHRVDARVLRAQLPEPAAAVPQRRRHPGRGLHPRLRRPRGRSAHGHLRRPEHGRSTRASARLRASRAAGRRSTATGHCSNGSSSPRLFVICWSALATFVLLKLVGLFVPLRMSEENMEIGDTAEHGHEVYPSDVPSLGYPDGVPGWPVERPASAPTAGMTQAAVMARPACAASMQRARALDSSNQPVPGRGADASAPRPTPLTLVSGAVAGDDLESVAASVARCAGLPGGDRHPGAGRAGGVAAGLAAAMPGGDLRARCRDVRRDPAAARLRLRPIAEAVPVRIGDQVVGSWPPPPGERSPRAARVARGGRRRRVGDGADPRGAGRRCGGGRSWASWRRAAPDDVPGLVARARRLGVDLSAGAVARQRSGAPSNGVPPAGGRDAGRRARPAAEARCRSGAGRRPGRRRWPPRCAPAG